MSRSSSKIKIPDAASKTTSTSADEGRDSPLPEATPASLPPLTPRDNRSTAVWRQWLTSMASDAEAALAAAIAYRDMDAAGREKWLSSLEFDAPEVDVPSVALYAPLLAVEQDPDRRERLLGAIGGEESAGEARSQKRALSGLRGDGTRVYVVAIPLYLDFAQVLACAVKGGVFLWVRHDPIVGRDGVPEAGDHLESARLETAPVKSVLDDLALAVLTHQRSGKPLPEALSVLSELLGPLGP